MTPATSKTGPVTVEAPSQTGSGGGQYRVDFQQEATVPGGGYWVTACDQNPWSVTIDGLTQSCESPGAGPVNIPFYLDDGSYSFQITPPAGFDVSPVSGTIDVSGAGVAQEVLFTPTSTTQTWTEGIVPALESSSLAGFACAGLDCYVRGVVAASATSDGISLWGSADGGQSWPEQYVLPGPNLAQSCYGSDANSWTGCVVAFGSTAYALGPEGATSATDESAFWVTTNGGQSWSEHDIAAKVTGAWLACADEMHCYVLAYGYGGGTALFSTSDGGQDWSEHALPGMVGNVYTDTEAQMSCPVLRTCVVASPSGVIETTDSGASWAEFGPAGAAGAVSCTSTSVCWLAAGTQIWVTSDSGTTWTQAGALPVSPTQMSCMNATSCLAVGPSGSDEAFLTTDGAHWTQQTLPNFSVADGAVLNSSGGFVLGLDTNGALAVWSDPGA